MIKIMYLFSRNFSCRARSSTQRDQRTQEDKERARRDAREQERRSDQAKGEPHSTSHGEHSIVSRFYQNRASSRFKNDIFDIFGLRCDIFGGKI